MILPRKLQPRTEQDILKEVSEELKIPIEDVKKTFNIWVDFVDHIANDTDQCTIYLPNIGSMFVNTLKMKRGVNTAKWREWRTRKLKEINKLRDKCDYIIHEKSYPIVLLYGLSKRNKYGIKQEDGKREFFTAREIINNQVDIFFQEDFEFSEQKKLKKYFIDESTKDN